MTTLTDSDRTVRRMTKLEAGLGGIGLAQLIAVVWFFARLTSTVEQLDKNVASLSVTVTALQSSAPEAAVLRYRVEQLEQKVATLQHK